MYDDQTIQHVSNVTLQHSWSSLLQTVMPPLDPGSGRRRCICLLPALRGLHWQTEGMAARVCDHVKPCSRADHGSWSPSQPALTCTTVSVVTIEFGSGLYCPAAPTPMYEAWCGIRNIQTQGLDAQGHVQGPHSGLQQIREATLPPNTHTVRTKAPPLHSSPGMQHAVLHAVFMQGHCGCNLLYAQQHNIYAQQHQHRAQCAQPHRREGATSL